MNLKAMNMFLSEDNIKRHLEYLRNLRLRFSVLEKSLPEIKGKDMVGITKLGIGRKIKDEALELLWLIRSHELFFNSFSMTQGWRDEVRKNNSSREKFVYDLLMEAREKDHGFLYAYSDRQNKIVTVYADKYDGAFVKYQPSICLDLCEHTYFNDYGFKKEKFLTNALGYFDTGKL